MSAIAVDRTKTYRFTDSRVRLIGEGHADTLFLFNDCDGVDILGCKFDNCVLRFAGCSRLSILRNFHNQCYGSHFIQFAPDDQNDNVAIIGNTFIGAGTPFYRDSVGGQPVNNGACGDVLAVRNVHRFTVMDNVIKGGGEFGITALHGSCDGVIANNLIENNDAAAIFVGNSESARVERIAVYNNTLDQCGVNGAGNAPNQMGIRIQNAKSILVSQNKVINPGRSLLYGMTASHCEGLTVTQNGFETDKAFRIPKIHDGTVTDLVSDVVATY